VLTKTPIPGFPGVGALRLGRKPQQWLRDRQVPKQPPPPGFASVGSDRPDGSEAKVSGEYASIETKESLRRAGCFNRRAGVLPRELEARANFR
jgi:hypothetical protein